MIQNQFKKILSLRAFLFGFIIKKNLKGSTLKHHKTSLSLYGTKFQKYQNKTQKTNNIQLTRKMNISNKETTDNLNTTIGKTNRLVNTL